MTFAKLEFRDHDATPRVKRRLRLPEPEVHSFPSKDGVPLRLTGYRAGDKGPVLLIHCIGVSSAMYSTDTIDTNLPEFLGAAGYDVWLLDYRLSIELPASAELFSMDDVAKLDHPAAVAKVRELTGADDVQVVAHGVGSSTFTMSLLSGLEGVRSAVLSQVSTHLFTPFINELKTGSRFPSILQGLGLETITSDVHDESSWVERLYDELLRVYPLEKEERCNNPVCHRISATYGILYEHDQLSEKTHDNLHELFGVANLSAFKQLALMTRNEHVVNAGGEDEYLPHIERMALPIMFLHGAENECVLPKSTQMTYDLLRETNGTQLYRRQLIPDYGHVDCMFGKNAANDVYPYVLEHLEATP